jgi:hypothetical protein
MTERLAAWSCIGCGRIEVPQPCIGVCQDRRAQLVYAADYDKALAEVAAARRHVEALSTLVRRLAWTTPRNGEWEGSYRALQAEAREVVEALAEPKVGNS